MRNIRDWQNSLLLRIPVLSSSILGIFGRSPIKPMQKHMDKIHACVVELMPFFRHSLGKDWENAAKRQKNIIELEASADELKKEIRLHLPNSLLMPVARTDLLGLLTSQDKIASKVKHIAGLVYGRRMGFPELVVDKYMEFLQRSIDASALAKKAINELDELVETGFRGKEAKIVENMILELDQVERDTDNKHVELRQVLFSIEKDLDPIDVIFLYKVIDWTSELADRAQHVGHRLESLLAQ